MVRLRHLAGDTIVYGLVSASRGLVGLVLVPLYTRIFLPSDYGYLDALTTFTVFLTILLTLGTDTAGAMYFYNNQGEHDRGTMAGTVFTIRLVLSCALCTPISLLAPRFSYLFFQSYEIVSAFRMAVWVALSTALISGFIDLLRLSKRSGSYTILSVANLVAQLLLIILFVKVWRWGIEGAFAGILGANLLIFPIVALMTKDLVRFPPSGLWLKKLLQIGLPLFPAAFCSWVMAYAGRYILLYWGKTSEVGLLAVGYKVSAPLALLTGAFLIAWPPFAFSIKPQTDVRELHTRTLTYFLIAAGLIGVPIGIFSREILLLFTTPDYLSGHIVTGLMVFQLMANTCYYIFSASLLRSLKVMRLGFSFPLAAAASIGLNLLLVSPLGFLGSAIASTFSYLLLALIAYFFSQRDFRISYEIPKVIRFALVCIGTWAAGISVVTDNLWFTLSLKFAILAIFTLALFFLRIVNRRELSLAGDWFRGQLKFGGRIGPQDR